MSEINLPQSVEEHKNDKRSGSTTAAGAGKDSTVNKKNRIIGTIAMLLILSVLAAVLALTPDASKRLSALSDTDGKVNQSSPITVKNSVAEPFVFTSGHSIDGASDQQFQLVGEKNNPSFLHSVFLFTNGKATDGKKVVDIYMDFGQDKSRDFFVMNGDFIKHAIETGKVDVRVHALPSSEILSVYSANALAEATATDPGKSWDFLLSLVKISAMNNSADKNAVTEQIVQDAARVGVADLSVDKVHSGRFAQWVLNASSDPSVPQVAYLPELYIDESKIDNTTVNINDPNNLLPLFSN